MAQLVLIPITDDNEVLSSSPLVILDTKYYELWYRQAGNGNWSQAIFTSPLKEFNTLSSQSTLVPCIVLSPLPDTTAYEFQVRRFDSDNNASDWASGSFTTGGGS